MELQPLQVLSRWGKQGSVGHMTWQWLQANAAEMVATHRHVPQPAPSKFVRNCHNLQLIVDRQGLLELLSQLESVSRSIVDHQGVENTAG